MFDYISFSLMISFLEETSPVSKYFLGFWIRKLSKARKTPKLGQAKDRLKVIWYMRCLSSNLQGKCNTYAFQPCLQNLTLIYYYYPQMQPPTSWKLSSMHHYDNTVFLVAS